MIKNNKLTFLLTSFLVGTASSLIYIFYTSSVNENMTNILGNNSFIYRIFALIFAVAFFFLLYILNKEIVNKNEGILILVIFVSGISNTVLNYLYTYNNYLIIAINSMVLLYFYYKTTEDKNKKKYQRISLLLTLFLGIIEFKYIYIVFIPFLITRVIIKREFNIKKNLKTIIIILVILSASVTSKMILEKPQSFIPSIETKENKIENKLYSLIDINLNFFGCDNSNNIYGIYKSDHYLIKDYREYKITSIQGVVDFVNVIALIIFVLVVPIGLYINYKKNDKKINYLLVFNTISSVLMTIIYLFFDGFSYSGNSLKYFLFNFVISIILGIYFLSKETKKSKLHNNLISTFLTVYIITNLYSTLLIVFN